MVEEPCTEVTGVVLDRRSVWSLEELTRVCQVEEYWVLALVEEGAVEPERGATPREWRFSGEAVSRIQQAERLSRDLGVNLPGAALALELMDQLAELREYR